MNEQKTAHSTWLAASYALAIFVGAFLVFQVQPVISKTILPWFGGSPAVWTTCMLFFQVVLFGGYVYAHLLSTKLPPLWQGAIHVAAIALALLLLPITPDPSWKPLDSTHPTWRIIALLGANVGLPYFLLSTTGPLLQSWFGRRFPGRSPYRLYALSNVGSLLALLTYPIAFEPTMTTHVQAIAWSLGFCAFALICGYLAVRWLGTDREVGSQGSGVRKDDEAAESDPPTWGRRATWLLLPAFASVMLLATTNHVCQDVAVIPFLWVALLSLYLLSFIICFDSPRWYVRRWYGGLTALSVVAACALVFWNVTDHLLLEIAVYFAALFGLCMLCHGELVRLKPTPRYLTEFYLLCSAGGAIGGVLVAILCPVIFSTFVEMHVGLLIAYLLAVGVIIADVRGATAGLSSSAHCWTSQQWHAAKLGLVIALFGLVAVLKIQLNQMLPGRLVAMRNFYGVLYVDDVASDDPDKRGRVMFHGRVAHGYQFTAEHRRRTPTMYFDPTSGIGLTFGRFPRGEGPGESTLRVGIIGLGAGTLAAYGEPGDYFRFYEINPHVLTLADRYFSFVKDSPAKIDVILGDARLSMEREEDQHFDILVLDAFSGDAIPAHLLTKEAFDIYRRHLKPTGVIAAHISNRHVDLAPVLANVARQFPLDTLQIITQTDADRAATSSHWVLLSNNSRFLRDEVVRSAAGELGRFAHIPLWTDQYSNLLQLLK